MGKVSKREKAIRILGVTGAVYLSFRYLLPLTAPFLAALLIGLFLNPAVLWLKRKVRIPASVSSTVLVGALVAALAFGLLYLGKILLGQLQALVTGVPIYMRYFNNWVKDCCCQVEIFLCLPEGTVFTQVTGAIEQAGLRARESGMNYVMDGSLSFAKGVGTAGAVLAIFLIASVLAAKDMEKIREFLRRSVFHEEIGRLLGRLSSVGGAWARSELTIFTFQTLICAAGLWLMKNPYALLAAVGIAFVDFLPIFGSGTVFVPWVIICVIQKNYGQAAALMTLYLICYFLRNTVEAKKMGNRLGLHPMTMLMAAFIGWQLFGLAGFLLGPIGLLIILEFI
ncbi:MAG: AI-2E family transporter [Lachnospiraceae bacterium]|nr:AI-2E family transporter [Lachnospiraceae bacterium]